jgi:predicted metalloprotease with PDZ domain
MNILFVYTTDPRGLDQDIKEVLTFSDGHRFNPYDSWHDILWEYLKLQDYEYLHVWTVKFLG